MLFERKSRSTPTEGSRARETRQSLLVLGIVLSLVGAFIISANWPGTDCTAGFLDSAPTCIDSGSAGGTLFGAFVAGLGQLFMLVSVIAYGVSLGVRASED